MIHGVLNVYKEKGYTSHDVVAKLRGIVGQKKIGHTGTLDPDATGVLPVCLGKATKLCDMLTDKNKTYETVLLLGQVTDTQDISGSVLERKNTDYLMEEQVREVIEKFVGVYEQIPPMYSALKVNGKKLYELARQGIEIERKARQVQIYKIHIKEIDLPRVKMEVTCSKGTYIRTLCHDIGQKLQCGGCMENLIRTRVSSFRIEDSFSLGQIAQFQDENRLKEILVPIDKMFLQYKKIVVQGKAASLVYNGNPFFRRQVETIEELSEGELVRVYDDQDKFIAIFVYNEEKEMFKLVKMFFDKGE
ncbi:tRNA pseudouridine(55) synthase TruB [Faecalimonas sp.]